MSNRCNPQGSFAVVLVVALGALLFGCGVAPSVVPTPDGSRYTVRGIVRDVSQLDQNPRRVRIEHESIDDFVNIDGEVEGMMPMTMTMVVWEKALMPAQVVVGDKVQFVLDVDWQRSPTGLVVQVEPLPADTDLALP